MAPNSQLEIQFPYLGYKKVIIAMKGLPTTRKSEIAAEIGKWARSQVYYIDDFLEMVSLDKGYTAESPPTGDEADGLHRLALEGLCRAALRYLHSGPSKASVVIKSRICSSLEIDLLMRMVSDIDWYRNTRVIIIVIDCQFKNEYWWYSQLGCRWRGQKLVWYKARSRKDIDKAMEDEACLDSQAWDLHLLSSLKANPIQYPLRVTRLVFDPFSHLTASFHGEIRLPCDFLDAIKYLLIGDEVDNDESMGKLALCEDGYKALQYDELRRALLERELRTSRERSNYLCTNKTTKAGCCVFKYREELPAADSSCCRVCGVRVGSGQPAYTCHFCILTLHKSCAEKLGFDFRNHTYDPPSAIDLWSYSVGDFAPQVPRHACESCKEGGNNFDRWCESCLFETHLKGGMLPTIINHDCHQLHFLSLQFHAYALTPCKSCGSKIWGSGRYGCHICNFMYHIECIFLPGEVRQEHGGHEHVLKLMYSRDSAVPDREDDHWCNACYKDMDPQAWFYSCQDCPYYVIHADSRCAGKKNVEEARDSGNIPIPKMRLVRDKLKLVDRMKPVD